jgi:large subunit ribosomal protein L21
MYAVVTTGGKQYRVEAGSELTIERLAVDAGSPVTFDRVLMVGDGDTITVGTPTVEGATVSGTVLGESLGPKLVIFKFKQKVKYRRMAGHRQHFTRVRIDEISASGKKSTAEKPEAAKAETAEKAAPAKRTRAAKADAVAKAEPAEAPAEVEKPKRAAAKAEPAEASVETEKPKRTRKPAAAKASDAEATEAAAADDKPKRTRRKAAAPKAESQE